MQEIEYTDEFRSGIYLNFLKYDNLGQKTQDFKKIYQLQDPAIIVNT